MVYTEEEYQQKRPKLMHELSITAHLLDLALQHGAAVNARRITDLYLVIGDLSSMVDESVQFYWDMITPGTLAEGARLHFERVPIKMRCLTCEQEFTPLKGTFGCSACGSDQVRIIGGDEFRLDSIGVECDQPLEMEKGT